MHVKRHHTPTLEYILVGQYPSPGRNVLHVLYIFPARFTCYEMIVDS